SIFEIRRAGDSYLSGRPRAIFHSRLSCRHVGLWTSQPRSTRVSVKLKIVSLSRTARGPDRWMSRRVMLVFGQRFMSHSKSIVIGSSLAASVVGCGCPCPSRSKIVVTIVVSSSKRGVFLLELLGCIPAVDGIGLGLNRCFDCYDVFRILRVCGQVDF